MAARKRPKQPAGSPPSGKPGERLIAAALGLASEQGWRRLGHGRDRRGGRPVARGDLCHRPLETRNPGRASAPDRRGDAGRRGRRAAIRPRDRLFDVLMRRFEAMRPYRAGLRAILRDSVGSPALLRMLPGLLRSMGWTLTAAGLPAAGFRGRLARRVVGAIYVSVLPTFFRDESRDLGPPWRRSTSACGRSRHYSLLSAPWYRPVAAERQA